MSKKFYQMEVEDVLRHFATDAKNGLSEEEVNDRREKHGFNEFAKKKHSSYWQKFIAQFKSFMIVVLLLAAVISGITGYLNGEGVTDALIILVILVVNAIIGVFQESKAEKSLDALEKLSAPHCKVIRDGELKIIATRELLPGDMVEIEVGDSVPADLRLIECYNLKVQESALTGESVPVEKMTEPLSGDQVLGDRLNMAFASCSVTYGRARGVVVATASATEMGKIASMIHEVPDRRTPMQRRLDHLGKILAIISLVVCLLIFIIGLCYGRGLMEMFMMAVSLAVAAIPEGLPAVSTVVLALGVQRLAKQQAIIRNLPSVETLGSTTIICSDKTGTLTQNKMTVMQMYANETLHEMGKFPDKNLIRLSVLANDALIGRDNNKPVCIGDPTETALLELGLKHGIDKDVVMQDMPRVAELPFDSERKRMSAVFDLKSGKYLVATKGGLDEVLSCCASYVSRDGHALKLHQSFLDDVRQANAEMASRALRVLAVAYKELDYLPSSPEEIEDGLIFVGLLGMMDPPRQEAMDAVARCKQAGIKAVMITGDHQLTASAIASQLGILSPGDKVLSGVELEKMSDEELCQLVPKVSVFARVAPEHKVRIVQVYQQLGNVVAMTGDGVNDAPALKLANIGVAMGVTGTDVSKEASDVVLADDNFATIVSAVREGRRIYDNLVKSIQFMISTNLGEILVLLVAVICNFDMPLLPIQLLFINLVGDSLPSLALSVDHAAKGIMHRQPIDSNQGIFTKSFTIRVLTQSIIIGVLCIFVYLYGLNSSLEVARTMTFAVLIFSQLTLIFSIRSGNACFTNRFFSNKWLWLTIVLVVFMTLSVMLIPVMQSLFKLAALNSLQWWMVIACSVGALFLSEICKYLFRGKSK